MKVMFSSATVVLLGCFLLSCGNKEESGETGSPQGTTSAQGSTAQATSGQLTQKLNVYVECINEVEPAIVDNIQNYASWVDFDKGPDNTGSVRGIGTLDPKHSFYVKCFDGLAAIASMGPEEQGLDKAGLAYKSAMENLLPITAEAAKYYKHSDYKDDDFKKGKELHPKLVDAIEKFMSARSALHENLDRVTDAQNAEKLLAIEKQEGRKVRFHNMNIMTRAKHLLSKVNSSDAAVLASASEKFGKAYQDAEAFNKANPELADSARGWTSFVSRAEKLHIVFKELTRLHSDKSAKASPKWDKEQKNAIEDAIKAYNKLVDKSNRMSEN